MSYLRFSLLIFLWLSTASAVAAPVYSNMYVFGDSLSDSGNLFAATGGTVPDPTYYNNGRFLNGSNYADLLWESLGFSGSLTPSFISAQGTNYALGGARSRYTSAEIGATGLPPGLGSSVAPGSLLSQITAYQADTIGSTHSDALHVMWIGGNDIADILEVAFQLGPVQAELYLAQSVTDVSNALTTLVNDEGARNLLVIDVPDIGLTPLIQDAGPTAAAAATAYSAAYNSAIEQTLLSLSSVPQLDITRFSSFNMSQQIVADPAAYGFTNVTDPCLDNFFVQPPATGTVTECSNPQDYLFWDEFHLSAAGHELLAQEIVSALSVPEPAPLLLISSILMIMLRLRKQSN